MPDITSQEVRTWLQKASLRYKNHSYIADSVFPLMPINQTSVKLWKDNVGDIFRLDSNGILAKGAEAHTIESKGSSVNISTEEYAFKSDVYDQDLEALGFNAGSVPPKNLQMDAVERVADKLMLLREKRVADAIIAAAWAGQSAGGEDADGGWSTEGSGNTFYVDARARINTLAGKGVPQDRLQLMMDDQTYRSLIQCDDVRDRIKYTQNIVGSVPTPMALANSIGLSLPVLVGGALYNSAEEKADGTDDTKARLWEANSSKGMAFLFYKPARIGLNMVSPGVQPVTMINGKTRKTTNYRDEKNHKWSYESREKLGCDTLLTNAGFMWKDTYAT